MTLFGFIPKTGSTLGLAEVWRATFNFVYFIFQRKCDIYWPKEGTEIYGQIEAHLEKEEIMADYTVRTIKLKHLKVILNL